MDEERAAVKIQALKRGNQARGDFKDVRDEEARRQWVEYYLQTRNYEEARELGWDGDPDELEASVKALGSPLPAAHAASSGTTGPIAITSDNEQAKAARLMQAHVRGSSARLVYREKRDDEARAQWVAYYLAMGDLESARELGWDESQQEQAQAATALAATRRGQLARRSLAAGVAIPGAMPFLDLPKPDEAAPATPERHAAFGGKTENETALDTAQEGAGIFSARWFGKLWNALLPEKSGREGEGEHEAEGGGMKEDAAAIIVQCWARVVLAKIAVKQEGRKYRLLALYAHVEEKNAAVIQTAFRNRLSFTGTDTIAQSVSDGIASRAVAAGSAMAGAKAVSYAENDDTKEEQRPVLCGVSVTPSRDSPSSLALCRVSITITPVLSHTEFAAKTAAALIAEAVDGHASAPSGPLISLAQDAAPQSAMPPVVPQPSRLDSGLGGSTTDLERKIAEIKANHAATVMQKLHRDAIKKDVCKRLNGALFKRSQTLPVFYRRSAYISSDGLSLVYSNAAAGNTRAGNTDTGKEAEKRIPLASITAIALESEVYLEFSIDSTIRSKKFLFRAPSRPQLQMWLNGLADLTP